MNTTKISILLPVYGAERFIERCAVSLFEQTYENIEYIFVNDCTKDKSIEVLQAVMERCPQRKSQVRIIHHKVNKGVGEARNTLLDATTGDFILFVDPDDYIDINLVEKLVNNQEDNDSDIVLFDMVTILKDGQKTRCADEPPCPESFVKTMLNREFCGVAGKMVRTSLFRDNGIRVECGVNSSEDMMILVRAVYFAKKISTCHGHYYYYDRRNENSITSNYSSKRALDDIVAFSFIANFFKDKPTYFHCHEKGTLLLYESILMNSLVSNDEIVFYEIKQKFAKLSDSVRNSATFVNKMLLSMPFYISKFIILSGIRVKSLLKIMSD